MKADIDYKFGQPIYLKNDPEQLEYLLNRIILEPKGRIVLELMNGVGEFIEVPEIHCTKEKDLLKTMAIPKDKDIEED